MKRIETIVNDSIRAGTMTYMEGLGILSSLDHMMEVNRGNNATQETFKREYGNLSIQMIEHLNNHYRKEN